MHSLKKGRTFPGLEKKACIIFLFWLFCQPYSPKFPVCHLCIKSYIYLFIQIMHFKYYHILAASIKTRSLLFYSRFIPSPKEEWHHISPAIPAAEIRQNTWNCYAFWNLLTIVAFWIIFLNLHRQAPVCSLEKTRQRIACSWTTKHECSDYLLSHFAFQG